MKNRRKLRVNQVVLEGILKTLQDLRTKMIKLNKRGKKLKKQLNRRLLKLFLQTLMDGLTQKEIVTLVLNSKETTLES